MEEKNQRLEEICVGLTALFSITVVLIISLVPLSPGWLFTLYTSDLIVCLVFAWEFVRRLMKSPQKANFGKYHGYEIIAIVPAIAFYPFLALSGMAAILRAVRLVRVACIVYGTNRIMRRSRILQLAMKTLRMI